MVRRGTRNKVIGRLHISYFTDAILCLQDAEECWIQILNNIRGLPGNIDGASGSSQSQQDRSRFIEQYMMGEMRSEYVLGISLFNILSQRFFKNEVCGSSRGTIHSEHREDFEAGMQHYKRDELHAHGYPGCMHCCLARFTSQTYFFFDRLSTRASKRCLSHSEGRRYTTENRDIPAFLPI